MARKRNTENKVVMSSGAGAAPARRQSSPKRVSRPAAAVVVPSNSEVVSVESVVEDSTEAVARLAYTYWAGRGYQGGSPEEDWLRAEQAVRAATASK